MNSLLFLKDNHLVEIMFLSNFDKNGNLEIGL